MNGGGRHTNAAQSSKSASQPKAWSFKAGFFTGVALASMLYLIFAASQEEEYRIFAAEEKEHVLEIPSAVNPATSTQPSTRSKPKPANTEQFEEEVTGEVERPESGDKAEGGSEGGEVSAVRPQGNYLRGSTQGRFGNCLFNYAAVVGIARRTGHIPLNTNSELARVFEIEKSTIRKVKNAKRLGDCKYKVGVYCSNTETLSPARNFSISGYRQSFKYFDFMAEDIRTKTFRFRQTLREQVKQVLDTYRQQGRALVGVHVRHNEDMLDLRNYKPAPVEYFNNAFNFYRKLLRNPLFVVVSDDKAWCRKVFQTDDVVIIGGKDKHLDFALASSCDHSVVSIGTFSWWTGYLSGGLVVYYKDFPFNGHNANKYVREDYYPSRWIGMNASSFFSETSYVAQTMCSDKVPAKSQPAFCTTGKLPLPVEEQRQPSDTNLAAPSPAPSTAMKPILKNPTEAPTIPTKSTQRPTTKVVTLTSSPTSAVEASQLSPNTTQLDKSKASVAATTTLTPTSNSASVASGGAAPGNNQEAPTWSVRVVKPREPYSYLFAKPKGRFGNKIFNVAATLGIALRSGHQPIATTSEMVNVFKIPGPKLERPGNTVSLIDCDHKVGIYCPKVESLDIAKNYTIKGYRQSFKYFDAYREEVREYFQFQDEFRRQADEILEKNRDGGRPFVGVHVRHNSNNLDPSRYKPAPKEYFEHAFTFFKKKLSNPIFLVISDDLDWCRKELRFEGMDVRFVRAKHYHGDFALASSCNHSVISIGTFSWWTGYLSGGTVVYYKKFPFNGRSKGLYVREDYYPPDWIGMDDTGL